MSDTLLRMDVAEVLAILVSLEEAGCSVWVAGGWGRRCACRTPDAAAPEISISRWMQMMSHPPLQVLKGRGYQNRDRLAPSASRAVAPGRGWVDLHPVMFGSDGHGRQADIGVVISTTLPMVSPRA